MNCLLDPSAPDIDAAAQRIITSESHGQLIPLFFEMLWRKQGRHARTGKLIEHTLDPEAVRVADAIIIQRGRPIQWYFSSLREKGVLLSKQRKNVTAEAIVDHFLSKKHLLSVSGICAQFIEPCETSRQGVKSTFISTEDFQVWLSTLPSSRSGILHRFLDPLLSPGASQNWEISCMWTPSALDAERIESNRDLKDKTTSSDLRCDVHLPEVSSVKRLVCARHVAMVDECCRAICDHVEAISGSKIHISTLELQCKVGADGHLVILYPRRMIFSSSLPAPSRTSGNNTNSNSIMASSSSSSSSASKNVELSLPCILPVKIPLEYQKVNLSSQNQSGISTSSAKHQGVNQSNNNNNNVSSNLFAQDLSVSSFASGISHHKNDNSSYYSAATPSSSSVILNTLADQNGFNFSSLSNCIVCKRNGSNIMKNAIKIPLKHVLLSLEVISSEREGRKKKSSDEQEDEIVVPLHISMLYPEMTMKEYETKRKSLSWGEERVDVCKECSTALQEAVKK